MTSVKIEPEGDSISLKGPSKASNTAQLTKERSGPRIPRYVIIAILGVLAALCVPLFLVYENPQNNGHLVQTRAQQSAVKQPPAWHCRNSETLDAEPGHVVIAIEFGETYSSVGAPVSSCVEILNIDGLLKTPNYVAYTDEGAVVGQRAKDYALINTKNTIFDVRRIIGRKFSKDASLQSDLKSLPYDVIIKNDQPVIKVLVDGKEKLITPEEVQAEVMKKMKAAAMEYYGQDVTSAIVTVPADFDDGQRQATKDAAFIAGLHVLRLVNEPTAASIGHKVDRCKCRDPDCEDFIVVYNLGERSVDITVSSIDSGVFEILSWARDRSIGGQNLDDAILDYALNEFEDNISDLDMKTATKIVETLKRQVKKAKQALSTQDSATIEVDGFSLTITLEILDTLHKNIFSRSFKHIKAALNEAKIEKTNISHLILTGNPMQVSKIQPFLEEFFDGKEVLSKVSSDRAILRGAVYQAGILSGDSDTGWVGAFDISGLSLGIETAGGLYVKIIPRNSVMPTRRLVNVTVHDNQSRILVNIIEGERPFVTHNKVFETVELTELPARPAGGLLIEIFFELDPNAILTVVARELEGGRQEVFQASVDLYSRYDAASLDAIIMDAEVQAEEDSKRRSAVDDGLVVAEGGEFGIVLVLREGEKPPRRN